MNINESHLDERGGKTGKDKKIKKNVFLVLLHPQ